MRRFRVSVPSLSAGILLAAAAWCAPVHAETVTLEIELIWPVPAHTRVQHDRTAALTIIDAAEKDAAKAKPLGTGSATLKWDDAKHALVSTATVSIDADPLPKQIRVSSEFGLTVNGKATKSSDVSSPKQLGPAKDGVIKVRSVRLDLK